MRSRASWPAVCLLALMACPVFDAAATARPGGGQGYSSPTGGGDSDSDDDGAAYVVVFELLRLAFQVTARYPAAMWPVWGVLAGIAVLWVRSLPDPATGDWTVGALKASEEAPPPVALERLRNLDPEFSTVLFEDFVYTLYARAHEARGHGRLQDLGAYLSPEAQRGLAEITTGRVEGVEGIVIGALRYGRVTGLAPDNASGRVAVDVAIEANYTETLPGQAGVERSAFWVREQWVFSRQQSARSLPPARLRSLGCPGCGAPAASRDPGVCAHCGNPIAPTDFDWLVDAARTIERRQTPPALTGDTAESGTGLTTIVDATADERRRAIEARDPAFTWSGFEARVRHIFAELQPAWSAMDLSRARPYLTDHLIQTWAFWFEAYQRAGLRNGNQGTRVTAVQLARVASDRHFDAITVRVRATGLDFTIDALGQFLSGSRDTPREYTEYWTLIRGQATTGAPRADSLCPRCGGPLLVAMGGDCEHCGAHVSSGDFDWVLSRVEQDDAYR